MRERLSQLARTHESWLLALVIAMCLFLTLSVDSFLTVQNLFDLITSNAFTGILASGLLLVLVAGGVDISFTAIATIAQYVAISLANRYGLGWIGLFAVACSVGVACGIINAMLVHKLQIYSVIVTIATLNIFYGSLIFMSGGQYITKLPGYFRDGINWLEWTDSNEFTYALNLQILLLVSCFCLTWVILTRTNIGRQLFALGGNEVAAQRLGFHVFGLRCLAYGYMGLIAAVASLSQAQLAQSVTPTTLVGKELDVLAAVVLGGASLAGGVGSVFGTILGVVLLAVLQNGLILLGVSSYWNQCFVGLVILSAVVVTAWPQRRLQASLPT